MAHGSFNNPKSPDANILKLRVIPRTLSPWRQVYSTIAQGNFQQPQVPGGKYTMAQGYSQQPQVPGASIQ
jgi:hypothetical protein